MSDSNTKPQDGELDEVNEHEENENIDPAEILEPEEAPVEKDPKEDMDPLQLAQFERDEYLASWQRAKADYQNLRRRVLSDIDAAVGNKTARIQDEMLTVLDYLDMALKSPCDSQDAKNLQMGVQMTRTMLWQSLEKDGVKAIATSGVFDPSRHQAMATIETNESEPGTILEVLRIGFKKGDRILRHAQVKVAAAQSDEAPETTAENAAE
ncbi:MAG: molecular chaperone GrpE [Glaciecola sp.]|jgi:molecular chaperone GrpE